MSRIIVLLISLFAFAQVNVAEVNFFSSLSPGSSARMIALGNVEGMSESSFSVFENPASLFSVNKFSTSYFTTTFMSEVVYMNGSVALRLANGVLGFGFMDLSVRDIPRTTYTLTEDNRDLFSVAYNFDYINSLYKLSYQISANEMLHYGVSGTYYLVKFDTVQGTAFNMDFGVFVNTNSLDISFVMKNFMSSTEMSFSDTDTEIPFCIEDCDSGTLDHWNNSEGETETLSLETIYSVKYKLRHFSFMGQFKTVGSDRDVEKSFGVEFNPTFLKFFSVYAGSRQFNIVQSILGEVQVASKTSQTVGVGLDLLGINFDYAYGQSDHVEYQHKHYFSLSVGL